MQLRSWKNLIHIHIPKCAGTNFERPLSKLPIFLNQELKSNSLISASESQYMHYLWHGNLAGKCNHDVFILEAFKDQKISRMQGSFLPIMAQNMVSNIRNFRRGYPPRKICLVRILETLVFPHKGCRARKLQVVTWRIVARTNWKCYDRYIYDYNLHKVAMNFHCQPNDYDNCDSIIFWYFRRSRPQELSHVPHATLMPNIVQFNRLNDDSNRIATKKLSRWKRF